MYGSHKLVKEIYKASLLCLEPDLRSGMTEEFEKLKEEFMYGLIFYFLYNVNLIHFLIFFFVYILREDEPKDGGVIVIDDDE